MRQTSAVTGIRRRPRYRERIEAEIPFMPAKYQLKQEKEYREKGIALEKESLALYKERLEKEEELATQQMEEYEKQAKKSSLIGLGQLGVTGYLGHKQAKATEALVPKGGAAATKTPWFSEAKAPTTKAPGAGFQPSTITPGFFSKEGLTSGAGWGGAAKTFAPYAGGALGITAGRSLFREGKGDRARRTVTGMAAGGAAGYLFSGGNPYATAISMFIGGIGSFF